MTKRYIRPVVLFDQMSYSKKCLSTNCRGSGRHRGIDTVERVCLYRFNNHNLLVVEDEYHVFFKCEKIDA